MVGLALAIANQPILTYKGRPTFVITQKEKEILLHLLRSSSSSNCAKKVLGFGIVSLA
jgi:hypothetical protein